MLYSVFDDPEPVIVNPEIEFQSPDMLTAAKARWDVVRVPPVNEFQLSINILIFEFSVTVQVPPAITLFP
jgi:hypothetical protein